MSYILDADWIINIVDGHQDAVTTVRHLAPDTVYVSWITVSEVCEVAFRSPNPEALLYEYRRLLVPFIKVGVTESIAERFAEIRSFLRRRGQLISDMDIFLAATALHYDFTVLTFNLRHFERIPDLRIYRLG